MKGRKNTRTNCSLAKSRTKIKERHVARDHPHLSHLMRHDVMHGYPIILSRIDVEGQQGDVIYERLVWSKAGQLSNCLLLIPDWCFEHDWNFLSNEDSKWMEGQQARNQSRIGEIVRKETDCNFWQVIGILGNSPIHGEANHRTKRGSVSRNVAEGGQRSGDGKVTKTSKSSTFMRIQHISRYFLYYMSFLWLQAFRPFQIAFLTGSEIFRNLFQSPGNSTFSHSPPIVPSTFFPHVRSSKISVISETPFLTFQPSELIRKRSDSKDERDSRQQMRGKALETQWKPEN
jgi:hypothetical protein